MGSGLTDNTSFPRRARSACTRRFLGAFVGAALALVWFAAAAHASTLSIDGTRFLVDGHVTYAGTSVEGLLLNSRMVQAVFDDENPSTVGLWAYPDTGVWDAERNTDEFVAALPSYASQGLRAFTVSLQGGRPVPPGHPQYDSQPWIVSAFNADGSLKPAWLGRLGRVVGAADAQGMVVILDLFYYAQDQRLTDEAAVTRGVDDVVDWLLANNYTNVLIEIANESTTNTSKFQHAILRPPRVAELITRVQTRSGGQLKASTSFGPGVIPPDPVLRAADFVLLHGNGRTPDQIRAMVSNVKATSAYQAAPKPIVFNEGSTAVADMDAAVGAGASWGYFDKGANNYQDGFQAPPVNWSINTVLKQSFFDQVAKLAGLGPPELSLTPATLTFSAQEGAGAAQQTLELHASDGSAADYTISDDASWLSVAPISGSAPATLTITADPTGIAAGTYTGAITANAEGLGSAIASVTLTVRRRLGSWTTKAPLPAALLRAGGAVLSDKLYLVGGRTNAGRQRTLYAYDPATNSWAQKASLPSAYPAVEAPAAAAYDGKLYVFGGQTSTASGAKTSAACYDPATNTWKLLAALPVARGGATAQVLGAKIYVAGGLDANGASLASVSVYDPGTNTWSSAAPMATRRDSAGSAVLDGKLYVFGGRTHDANGTTPKAKLATVEAYDPATNAWTVRAPMPTARRGLVVGTIGARAEVIGGEKSGTAAGTFAQNEEYDPATNAWQTLAAMPTPRQGAVAGTIAGLVYVAGGGAKTGTSYSSVNEVFAP